MSDYEVSVANIYHHLETTIDVPTGWLHQPLENQENLLNSIQLVANEIKLQADVLVVVGVGGSFLGARAIQDALTPYFGLHQNGIEVVYAGQNMSGAYIKQLLDSLATKEVYVNVISKSGTTMEPALAFRLIRFFMQTALWGKSKKSHYRNDRCQKRNIKANC